MSFSIIIIRSTPTLNAFLSNLSQILDYNFAVGDSMLLNSILILQKIPFPPRYATSWQQAHTLMQESLLFQGCGFSLWYLEPSLRKNWLMSALVRKLTVCVFTKLVLSYFTYYCKVIFYKYNFNRNAVLGEKASGIVRIILHTLANHAHECDRYRRATLGTAARSRDLSQLSIGESQSERDNMTEQQQQQQQSGTNMLTAKTAMGVKPHGILLQEDEGEEKYRSRSLIAALTANVHFFERTTSVNLVRKW